MHTDPLVYVVDDDQAMLESLSWLIESVNLKVQTYRCTKKFLMDYDRDQHSCVLLDVRMPGMTGSELQKTLNTQTDNLPIIFISGYVDVSLVVQTIKNGAIDFLIKPFNDMILIESINKALQFDKALRDQKQENYKYKERVALLSQREIQVLQGILASEKNKLISNNLKISLKTVESHRASMMKKMNVNSVVELIKLVVVRGI